MIITNRWPRRSYPECSQSVNLRLNSASGSTCRRFGWKSGSSSPQYYWSLRRISERDSLVLAAEALLGAWKLFERTNHQYLSRLKWLAGERYDASVLLLAGGCTSIELLQRAVSAHSRQYNLSSCPWLKMSRSLGKESDPASLLSSGTWSGSKLQSLMRCHKPLPSSLRGSNYAVAWSSHRRLAL